MNRKGAILIPALTGLIFISLALAVGAFYSYQNEHAKAIQLQAQVDELTTRQKITEGKLADAKKEATELQLRLQEAKAQITALGKDLEQEKSARLEASNKLEQFKADLEQQKTLRKNIENSLDRAHADGNKLNEEIKIIKQQKEELEAKIKDLETGASEVQLGKVVVNSEPAAADLQGKNPPVPLKAGKKSEVAVAKNLEGKVMVVNKEYNFVVINLGSKDGINTGDLFSVYHGGKIVGEVKVEKVHESMSAAGFAVELKDTLKENDKVVQKAK